MKLNLSAKDALQLSKAIKSGCLDTDKVECLNALVQGYNPPKLIKESELEYYLKCIYKGWGIKPKAEAEWIVWVDAKLPDDLMEKCYESIINGTLYKKLIRYIFWGLTALEGLGYKANLSHKPNFDWIKKGIPKFD